MKRYIYVLTVLAVAGCHHDIVVPGGTVSTDSSGKVTSIQTKDGSMKVEGNKVEYKDNKGNTAETNATVSEADLGFPFYPGSVETAGSMKFTENGKQSVICARTTTDSPTQVMAFFNDKLGKATQTAESQNLTMGAWDKDGKKVTAMLTPADGKTLIQVTVAPK